MNPATPSDSDERAWLETRLGRTHARQRLGMEDEHDTHVFRFFHLEDWSSLHAPIRSVLRLTGMAGRGRRNSLDIRVVHHDIELDPLPAPFHGFRVLHLSDLHVDQSPEMLGALIEKVRNVEYDMCVLTGDYRFAISGSIDGTIEGMKTLRDYLADPVFAVLGNHDSARMVPAFERMGIRMLMNESEEITRNGASLYVVGVDDAHYFGVHNLEKALLDVPTDVVTILLSHTPELYRQAAHAGLNVMLSGHTHGGQICLPGGYPITLDARIPRRIGKGRWRHGLMTGYTSPGCGTSIVPARFNCPAEITLHRLAPAPAGQQQPHQ